MDKWVTVTKSATIGKSTKGKQPGNRYNPGENASRKKSFEEWRDERRQEGILDQATSTSTRQKDVRGSKPSASSITRHLLKSLSDESNPITHSNIYERTDHVVSLATGHQRSERRGGGHTHEYFDDRQRKLADQKAIQEDNVLSNVRVYINGYLSDTTDIEMKRVISLAGGTVLSTPSRATHILTSQYLNASKTHKLINSKSKTKPHVVRPEWVIDSMKTGRRQPEILYSVMKRPITRDLVAMMQAGTSKCRSGSV